MYDVIIVGGGSAGCVLAGRLSENPAVRVLLLEAGKPDDRPEMRVPAAFSRLFQTEYDWNFQTVPQAALDDRRLYLPRGKTLGGSSTLNAMIYIRGSHAIYDGWAAAGNPGWAFADVLPYFKRMENQARGADRYHGAGGPLSVEDLRDPRPQSLAFVRAACQRGLPHNPDFNGPQVDGAGLYQVTMQRGARHSAATAYLKPARNRPNLTVQTETIVRRVLHDGTRFSGVEIQQGDLVQVVGARREVILCGGAYHTPHLLMLSGVGPGEALQRLGIDVVLDLPGVGQNLQDHLATGVMMADRSERSLLTAESPGNMLKYLLARVGPLTSNVAEAGAFVRTDSAAAVPDIQYHFGPNYYLRHGLGNPPGHGFSLGPVLVTPRSRGAVTLASADPHTLPRIDPRYLTDPDGQDMASLVAGLRLARDILNAPALAPFRGEEVLPGADVTNEAGLQAYIRQTSETFYHPVGTAKMGPGDDPLAVVGARLCVHGVEGLRVVDASVMPLIPNGNTNAPTMMIAEKAADLILQELA